MRRIEVALCDGIELRKKRGLGRDWKCDSKKLGSLDLLAKLRALSERAVMVGYIALRSRMG
jgi:hypothetical protein